MVRREGGRPIETNRLLLLESESPQDSRGLVLNKPLNPKSWGRFETRNVGDGDRRGSLRCGGSGSDGVESGGGRKDLPSPFKRPKRLLQDHGDIAGLTLLVI